MATVLTAQLAQIRTHSTNPLDLKAQKKAHSQSLLFDGPIAATQDFDSIYQICKEGFDDLCRLDSRFIQYTGNVFSEESKKQDRSQMTAAQNGQLDKIIEDFFSLVGSKLLLKPALKAVEWLVRRFRVHENNVQCLLLTFLPYHTTAIFPTVLSILPPSIPKTFKFLHPYIQSRANPPRHTIVYTASHSRPFLSALSYHMLQANRLGYHQPTLTSFWASVATEAVAVMLYQTRSARHESQREHQDSIVIFLLPILNECLAFKDVPDLRTGSYMLLTVLASKAHLDDGVITVLMEAITKHWHQTSHAGLICLSVLAEQKKDPRLPRKVLRAVIALDKLEEDMKILRKQYRTDNLVLGVILGVLEGLKKYQDASRLHLVKNLIESDLMKEGHSKVAMKHILSGVLAMTREPGVTSDVQDSLTDLLLRLLDSSSTGTLMQSVIKDSQLDVDQLEARLQMRVHTDRSSPDQMIEDVKPEDSNGQAMTQEFDDLTSRIPTQTAYEISFLSHSDSYVFDSLANAFSSVSLSDTNIQKFSDLPVLRRSLAMSEPLFVSFFIRIWCGGSSPTTRTAAIQAISRCIEKTALTADVQILLPYLIYGLADSSKKVRLETTQLVLVLARAYTKAVDGPENAELPILGREQIYGQRKAMANEKDWLSMTDIHRFMQDLLIPGLEECLVDPGHICRLLLEWPNSSKHSKRSKNLHKDLKRKVYTYLCSHVVNTPLYRVKSCLLDTLNQATKVNGHSCTKSLLPIVSQYTSLSQDEHERICKREGLVPSQFLDQVVGIIMPSDSEGIQILRDSIQPRATMSFPSFRSAALRRIQAVWPSLKPEVQTNIGNALLEQTLGEAKSEEDGDQDSEAIETLKALPMPTSVLQSFLDDLLSMSSRLHEEIPASKRRRTSHSHSSKDSARFDDLSVALARISLVLELVEDAKAERHPELLKGLFQVLSQLQQLRGRFEAAPDYLLMLIIDSMLSIVKRAESSSSLIIDHSVVQTDVLIDCIRTTSNPQVRSTALLLVSALASVTPKTVLHSIMPIFTFMGANIVRQDDDFSVYVVNQTMENVIPRLVQSLHQRKDNPFAGVSEILLSFAAAFEHIPARRRLDLFGSLANKVGPNEYLSALLVILVDKYPNDKKVWQFAADLTSRFDETVRLQTVERYLEVILDARNPKPTLSVPLLILNESRKMESAIANLLQLPPSLLSDQHLISRIGKVLARNDEDAATIRSSYAHILEVIFLISEQAKKDRNSDVLCMRILNASLGLLPMSEFVQTLQNLLSRTEDCIRRQVLRSFAQRLSHTQINQKATATACLDFLPRLLVLIQETPDNTLRHIAVGCLDRITETFGRKATTAITNAAQVLLSDNCIGAVDVSLRVVSLLCLATMVEVLGESSISIIPDALPKAVHNLDLSIQADTDNAGLHNAVYTFLNALLLYVPWVATGTHIDRLLEVSYESANADMGEECDRKRIEVMQLIPKQVEAKECFDALKRTCSNAITEGPLAVKEFLGILHLAVNRHPNGTIVKLSGSLGDLFLKMFDLRRIQLSPPTEDSYTIEEIEEVEDAVNECTIAMVKKLNDAAFRPLFSRMLDWTISSESKDDGQAKLHRQSTWYTFLLKLFDTFKSSMTNYAGFIIDNSVDILNKTSSKDQGSILLCRKVILALHKTFEHAVNGFYQSPAHFAPVSSALLSQLARGADIPLLPELIPAIAELVFATDSATHHKEMNTAILQYMRSDNPAVRLASVQCERALTEKLSEEWLAHIAEMLPFINEGLEDDDEMVEREVLRWKKDIENITGESLDPMLQ